MELAIGAIGILPVAVGLVSMVEKFYNTYQDADKNQSQHLLKLDVERLQFTELVKTTGFTDREAILERVESQDPELAEDLRVRYALACKIIWQIVTSLQEAADLIAPPEKPTHLQVPTPTKTKRPGFLRRASSFKLYSFTSNSSTPDLKSSAVSSSTVSSTTTLVNCGDNPRPFSQNLNLNPAASEIHKSLEELSMNSGSKTLTTVKNLEELLKVESVKVSDSCNRLSKRVKLKEAAASTWTQEPKLAKTIDDLGKWNKALRKTLEKKVDNNAKAAAG